jgi:hypothetical protein
MKGLQVFFGLYSGLYPSLFQCFDYLKVVLVDSCNSFGSLNRLLPLLHLSWALKYGVGEGYGSVFIFEFHFCANNYVGFCIQNNAQKFPPKLITFDFLDYYKGSQKA